ncbi:uncharacterized protein Dwil_GK13814 [Drosophila willistoni]|uniref:Serine protease K12H4.7 n=1 Tax=Drosophila willistoni TaxID=7260 RepID=B4NJ25_DROWI|nr:putative serine protease K12H4.7 [Drosophila willistoni]EDW83818.2 uncharacterized protein Dwil_GK13814 [Drosophila willistoni]
MAVENSGMLFYTEHRYYGQSWPLGNASLGIEQLKYLSLPQALADLAHFIEYQKSDNPNLRESKVILVGGSYSGSMVTWMTRLYPHLIAASWASSAPLFAKADFYEYMEMVSQSINLSYGHNCSQRIDKGLKHLSELFKENLIEEYLKRLNACKNFNPKDTLDRAAFFSGISNYLALIVQSYSSHIPNLCETLMLLDTNDEEAFLAFLELIHTEGRRSSNCQDFGYEAVLKLFTEQSLDYQISGVRAWFYQTCNEFGWYTTTTATPDLVHEVPLVYFENLCRDTFGPAQTTEKLARGIAEINKRFGGHAFNHSQEYKEVIFTHGQLDPWSALGLREGKDALVLNGYSHCQDLTSINIHDSVEMNLAKLRVMSFLRRHI